MLLCIAAILVSHNLHALIDEFPAFTNREKLLCCLLVPFNLHLVYIAIVRSQAIEQGDADYAHQLYFLFCQAKVVKTGLESLPVGVLTLGALGFARGSVNVPLLISSSVISLLSYWPRRVTCRSAKITLADDERSWLATYSCRNARCFKPIDRATVLAMVRDEWGSEAAFDRFVRTELPRILARSKKLYSTQMLAIALKMFDVLFGV